MNDELMKKLAAASPSQRMVILFKDDPITFWCIIVGMACFIGSIAIFQASCL